MYPGADEYFFAFKSSEPDPIQGSYTDNPVLSSCPAMAILVNIFDTACGV